MSITNIIVILSGIITMLFGIGALLNPNIARFINAPGGPRIKAIIALMVGAIITIFGYLIELPG